MALLHDEAEAGSYSIAILLNQIQLKAILSNDKSAARIRRLPHGVEGLGQYCRTHSHDDSANGGRKESRTRGLAEGSRGGRGAWREGAMPGLV